MAGHRIVFAAVDDLQRGDWSLDTIADDIEAALRYEPCPDSILGTVVATPGGAAITIAEWVRGSRIETPVRARLLVNAILARATGEMSVDVIDAQLWRADPSRACLWGAAMTVAVSRDDLECVLSGETTADAIGARRDVPSWLVQSRYLSGALFGQIEANLMRTLVDISHLR